MTRLFFDIVRNASSSYDFHGRYVRDITEAREMAEIVSFDLACSEKESSDNSEIQVRDSFGKTLFSVPIQAAEAAFT
jgi:hypothetical protein